MVAFETGNRDFDRLFKTRHAVADVASTVEERAAAFSFVRTFRKRWARPLDYLVVTGGTNPTLRCRLYDFQMYTSARVLRRLLPDLSRLASFFDSSGEYTEK